MLYKFDGNQPTVGKDTYVSDSAIVIGNVIIGDNCYIGHGSILRGDYGRIEIGDGTSIQDNCVIHADRKVVINQNITVGHGAIIHDVILKARVVVGMGTILMNGVVAEEDALIGAGSIVKEHFKIPPGKIVVGNSGRGVCLLHFHAGYGHGRGSFLRGRGRGKRHRAVAVQTDGQFRPHSAQCGISVDQTQIHRRCSHPGGDVPER